MWTAETQGLNVKTGLWGLLFGYSPRACGLFLGPPLRFSPASRSNRISLGAVPKCLKRLLDSIMVVRAGSWDGDCRSIRKHLTFAASVMPGSMDESDRRGIATRDQVATAAEWAETTVALVRDRFELKP